MVYGSYIKVDVRKSNTEESYFIIQKESKGKNKSRARINSKKIKYNYKIVDNTIVLDAYFLSEYRNLWKDEEINVVFYIPENVTIFFDNSSKHFLSNIDNDKDIYDKDMANHHFIMTDKTLKCSDCDVESEENTFEFKEEKNIKTTEETI